MPHSQLQRWLPVAVNKDGWQICVSRNESLKQRCISAFNTLTASTIFFKSLFYDLMRCVPANCKQNQQIFPEIRKI